MGCNFVKLSFHQKITASLADRKSNGLDFRVPTLFCRPYYSWCNFQRTSADMSLQLMPLRNSLGFAGFYSFHKKRCHSLFVSKDSAGIWVTCLLTCVENCIMNNFFKGHNFIKLYFHQKIIALLANSKSNVLDFRFLSTYTILSPLMQFSTHISRHVTQIPAESFETKSEWHLFLWKL